MGERIKVYAAYVIVIGGVAALLYFFVRYALGVMLPFLIGWAAALLVRRPARFLHRRLRIKEGE